MIIRPALEKDHTELSRIMRQSIRLGCRKAYGGEVVDAWTDEANTVFEFTIPERTFAGERAGKLLGFCSWVTQADDAAVPEPRDTPIDPATGYARINRMFLLPDAFGTGLARSLLQTTEDAARKDGFCRFVLWSSLNALRFYKAAGYREREEEIVPVTKNYRIPIIKMSKEAGF